MPVPGARLFFHMLLRDGCVLIGVPGLAVGARGQSLVTVTVTVMVTICTTVTTLPALSLHVTTPAQSSGEPPTGSSSAYRTQAQLEAQAQSRSRRASQTQSAHQRRHRHISKSVFRSSVHLLICPSTWPLSDDPSPAHGAGSVYTHPYHTIDGSQLLSRFSSRS